jgi:hypothetical protein
MNPGKLILTATFLCILQMPVMAAAEASKETDSTMAVEESAATETAKETEPTMTMEESAATETAKETEPTKTEQESDTSIENVLPELALRPFGLIGSAAGLGFYVASLPFVAVVNLLEPHDTYAFTYDAFIRTPFRFTFQRPIGNYSVPISSQ